MSDAEKPVGFDLTKGVAIRDIPTEGVLAGHVGEDKVLLAWVDGDIVAVSGACTHYSGPLEKGLRVGDTIRCPWHHACFSLKTGAALEAPALSPLDRWRVEEADRVVTVTEKLRKPSPLTGEGGAQASAAKTWEGEGASAASLGVTPTPQPSPVEGGGRHGIKRVVIVGGGAAGFAAAQRLRDLGYAGELTLVSDDKTAPYDRPNVSKDYLAGEADPAWMPLKDEAFYVSNRITLMLGTRVEALNTAAKRVSLAGGASLDYDALLLATGAEPNRPDTPGFDKPNVHLLRTLADADALIDAAKEAKVVAVVGASFIGLEAAAAFIARGLRVHVIAPEDAPLGAKLGPELGGFVKGLHQAKGVDFHLGRKVRGFDGAILSLDDNSTLRCDLVVAGVGVKPRLDLAKTAGINTDKGVLVDACFRTSAEGVFAAGDIAEYPDPVSGARIRVEHWVAAERQGQIVAANMLGLSEPIAEPPFFWSAHFGVSIRYVGHAESWDRIEVDGDLSNKDAEVRYIKDGEALAVATVGRDMAALKANQAMRDRAKT
jgi:NADPH-dependent 2,4-dienoyl-CoA reductase/sulfur reductase-like enzyme/nitrite reductase/ring-hydroxylating ferredoxin subunit